MISDVTSVLMLAAVAAVVLAVPPPASAPAASASSAPAAPAAPVPAENTLRTVGREDECRPGLCPHIRRLVPDLSHAPPHFLHQSLARNEFVGEPSLCGNLCVHDRSCASHQKCCPTTCGYACQDTVYIHDDEGEY